MTHHVIYVPGLGDTKVTAQQFAVNLWRFGGVHPHLFQMKWADDEPFATKFERLLVLIDNLLQNGTVSLVGASAGASVVINAFAARPDDISGVVCIAGKINNPQAIGPGYKRKNPSFWESAQATTASLEKLGPSQRQRILSIRSRFDMIVPAKDSILPGAHNRVTWITGHIATIAVQITLGAPFWLHFLKTHASRQSS